MLQRTDVKADCASSWEGTPVDLTRRVFRSSATNQRSWWRHNIFDVMSFSPFKFSWTALKALEAPKGSLGSQFRYGYLKSPLERDTKMYSTKCTILCWLCVFCRQFPCFLWFARSALCMHCVLQVHSLSLFSQAGCRSTLRSSSLGAEALMLRRLNQRVNRNSNMETRGTQQYCMDR